ncbi:MAG: hypothetical protein ACYC7D_06965 [Nitrososphaerales archaeon]
MGAGKANCLEDWGLVKRRFGHRGVEGLRDKERTFELLKITQGSAPASLQDPKIECDLIHSLLHPLMMR